MERLFDWVLHMALTALIASGGGYAARALILSAQHDAKGAMSMGMSYGHFNRQLIKRKQPL